MTPCSRGSKKEGKPTLPSKEPEKQPPKDITKEPIKDVKKKP